MAVDTLNVALMPAPASGAVSSRLTRRWPGWPIALVVVAGGVAKLAPLLAAVALNAFASTEETAAYYIAFTYAQALSFYCHFGAATTALAALVRANVRDVDAGVLALRLLGKSQRTALPVVLGVGTLLLFWSGFQWERVPLIVTAIVAAYGMAYAQVKMTCLLALRADHRLARYTVLVAIAAYGPLLLALVLGWTRYVAEVLAFGYALSLLIDLARAPGRWKSTARIPVQDCLRGGGSWTLGNSVFSLVALLVVFHVEATLSVAGIVAFGIVQQLRLGLQFVAVQVGPFVNRAVTARLRDSRTDGLRLDTMLIVGGASLLTLLLTIPLIVDARILQWLFSGNVPLDAAVVVGLIAATFAAMVQCLGRILEARQDYRAILISCVAFAVGYGAIVYGGPASHLFVQIGFLAASVLQATLLAWMVWRNAGERKLSPLS